MPFTRKNAYSSFCEFAINADAADTLSAAAASLKIYASATGQRVIIEQDYHSPDRKKSLDFSRRNCRQYVERMHIY